MKKFIFTLVAALMSIATFAQTTDNYAGSSKFFDNWSVGVNGGVQTNLYDWNAPQGAVAGITLNKQLTPLFGLTADVNTGINNWRNWNHGAWHTCNKTALDNLNAFVLGRFNLSNAFFGYKGVPRVFEVEALAGPGYGRDFTDTRFYDDLLLAKAGLNLNLNLGKAKAWTIYVQPAVVFDLTSTGAFDNRNAVGQLTAGVVYHFKTSNGTRHIAASPVPALLEENAALQAALAEARSAQTVPVTNAVAQTVEVVKEVTKYAESTYVVAFAKNSAELTADAKTTLDAIAKNTTVVVDAYASPEGTEAYNKTLSQKRADAVKDYLAGNGVTVENATGLGVVGNASNRIAIVTVK